MSSGDDVSSVALFVVSSSSESSGNSSKFSSTSEPKGSLVSLDEVWSEGTRDLAFSEASFKAVKAWSRKIKEAKKYFFLSVHISIAFGNKIAVLRLNNFLIL